LGVALIGVDSSTVAIAQARAVPTTVQARWLHCDFEKIPLEAASALGVVSLDGISVAADPRAMLREVARISMPGAALIFTACVPRMRAGALDWQSGLREHHFAVVEHLEVSDAWHAWLRKKHERRLDRASGLSQKLEEGELVAALRESRALLADDRFMSQRRYRITARYEPASSPS
jgi:ubiquinone/menaquinone biosynthesis C-methylase UbiE